MEHDVVLSDEVQETRVIRLPPLLPVVTLILRPLFGGSDVADGRIEPHVKHLAFRVRQRYRHTPFEITGHRAWAQPILQPAVALAQDLRFPFACIVLLHAIQHPGIDPRIHPFLRAIHGQVPMLGGAQYRGAAAQGAAHILQFLRA